MEGKDLTPGLWVPVWQHYLQRWVFFNTVRSAAAIVAALLFTIGLMGGGNA